MRRLFQISEKYFGRKLPSGRRAGLKFSSVPTYFSTLFREFVGRYSHTLHDTAGGWTFSAVAPATATLTGANDISDLASGVVYHVDNTAAVSVSLDSQVAGVWTFVIMKTTAAATPKTFSVLDENGPYGLAGAGSIVYGAVDEEHIGKRIVVYGSGTAGTDGYAISETAPPEDIIGEVQVASVDISTLKAGYVYPVAHTAACSLTIGTIATQGMWRFEIAASTDTAAAGFAITLDGTNLASGADVVFGGADDEQFGRVFRVISDGTKAYVDYVAKDIVGATIEGTTAVDVGADCEAGVLYPIDATAGTAGAVTLNLTDKTAGIYKFQIIATTLHATDFPTVTGGPDLYDGSASKVLGGVGPIADFIGQTFTLTCDGTKWSYGSPKKPLYLEDNTVLTSDATNTSIVSFATNGVRIINSAAADAPLTASAGTFSGLVTTSLGLDVSGAALTVTNQAITQTTGGQVTLAGNLNADAGVDVTGAALTIANQAITQTTGGQVTLAGNVDANAGVDVAGANLTCGTFAVTVATGALTTGGGGITSATGTLTDGVASFDGAGELTGAVAITSEEYLGDTDFEASAADGEDDNAGSDVLITSGRGGRDEGGSGGDGGEVVIQASNGTNWASSTPGNGGSVEIFAGDGGRVSGAAIEPGGYGGPFDIYSGAGGDGTATRPSGAGGGMTINAGPAGTDNGGGDGGDGVVAIGSENTDSIEIGNVTDDPITKILGDGGIAANHYRSDGSLWVHPNDAEDDQDGNSLTIQAADGGDDAGGSGGDGGGVVIQASDGANWASSTPGNGGSVEMFAGDGGRVSGAAIEPGGYGGPFDIYSGAGGDGTATRPSGAGGGMTINAGPAGTDNGGGDGGDGVVAIGSENTDSIEIGNDIGDPITKILGDGGIAANHYRSDGDLWVHPNDAEDDQGGNDVTVQAADGGADDGGGGGYGGNATLAGGHGTVDNDAGGIYLTAGEAEGAGDGGNVTINAGDSDSGALGKILIGDDGANSIEIGNAIDTPTLSQLGTGQVAFAGNVNADAGLDVAGAALTVTNQAITQTTGGQVTLAGNVDANAGVDVAGANLTCGTFAVTVGTGALTTGGGGITSATGALGDGVASFDGSGALSAVTTLGMTGALSGATSVSATTLTDGTMTITGGDLATVGAVGCDSVTATGAVEGLSVTDGTATMTTGALDGVTSLSSAQVKQPAVTETAGGAITSFPPGAVSLIDNSAGPVTIAFPAAPATGAIWHLGIKSDTSGANTVTLETDSSGGDLVSGMSGDVVICGARNYAGSSFSIFTDGAKYYCSRFGDASFGDVYGDAATFSAGVAVTGALTATTHTTAPQTFLEDSGAPTADDKNGTMAHRVIKATYDFGVHGGAETSINIGLDNAGVGARAIVIPAGSMIKKTYLYVETAFAATGATNVSFGIATDIDVIAATAFGDALYTVDTVAEGIQDGTPALMEVLAGTVTINIEGTAGAATLTAGRAHLFIEYMTAL